ncbi:NAD-dependent epimerase/dehydratase family protein [Kribbella swartbergensis]
MRIVVTGATGNVGTAVMTELLTLSGIDSVAGIARRPVPHGYLDQVEWHRADVAADDLLPLLRGADAVVHLAWLFQPTHQPEVTWRTNVEGTARVLRAAAESGVATVVVASSVGAYSARRSATPVDETWPTDGVPTAAYSREKAYVERLLDSFEHERPGTRVVRMRTAFVFQRVAAVEQRRIFLGPLVPASLVLRHGRIPFLPDPGGGLVLQALHATDAARAYGTAVLRPVRGAFNVASEPVLDMERISRLLKSRAVPVPFRAVRAAMSVAWGAHLVPAAPGLLDLVRALPVMATDRAREELEWEPKVSSISAVEDFLDGLRSGEGGPTPPLAAHSGGPLRWREFATGVGARP